MMRVKQSRPLALAFAAALLFSTAAFPETALAGHRGNEREYEHGRDRNDERQSSHPRTGVSGGMRTIIYGPSGRNDIIVIAPERREFCPPGLARKRNGCVPSGQAAYSRVTYIYRDGGYEYARERHTHHRHRSKKYRIGHCLEDTVRIDPVPRSVLTRLEPVPYGYRYVRVDDDILLMAEAGKLVIDAVTLLSAAGSR